MAVTFPPSGKSARQRRRAVVGFVAGFALLLALSAAGWVSSLGAIPSFEWVTETQQRIIRAEGLMRMLAEAESAGRAYVVTGEGRYLEAHRVAISGVVRTLDEFTAAAGSDPAQGNFVRELRDLVSERLAGLGRAVAARREQGFEAAAAIVAADEGAGVAARIDAHIAAFISSEVVVRSRQEAAFIRRSRRATIAIGLALIVTTLLMAFAVRWLHRRMRDLENIVTVCAWTKRVKHRGRWVSIEEYLQARYGLQFSHGVSEEARRQLQIEALEAAGRTEPPAGGTAAR